MIKSLIQQIFVFLIFYNVTCYSNSYTSSNHLYHPCIRTCKENQTMSCHYHFTMERYVTMGTACKHCYPNSTVSQLLQYPTCQCIFADGFERGVLTINRMIPGPSIQVCKGDKLIIDVHNQIDGQSTSLHWHGLYQRNSQYYDGVPFVTQCPIYGGTSFRYQFEAGNAGTHFYHSHTNVQMVDGIYGSLIVRESRDQDLQKNYFDEDLPEHVLLLSDFMHVIGAERVPGYSYSGNGQFPESFLINGLGRYLNPNSGTETDTPYEIFTVQSGKRYRFRLINSIGTSCEARLTFQNHPMTVIASDGDAFDPFTVDSIVFYSGERFDVVIDTKKIPGTYWIHVMSPKGCLPKSVHQLAILRYEGHPLIPQSDKPTVQDSLPEGKIFIDVCDPNDNRVCATDLFSKDKEAENMVKVTLDHQIVLPYEMYTYEGNKPFEANTYSHFLIAPGKDAITSSINGISFVFPSVPPLSQPNDIEENQLCNSTHKADCKEEICNCPHTLHFNLGDVVEFVLIDYTKSVHTQLPHPFHLHGHSFYVMALGRLKQPFKMDQTKSILRSYTRNLRMKRIIRPIKKDTILIPHNSYAILRVKLDNPGYWFFHCHFAYHLAIGMSFILHVGGTSHLPEIPKDFPMCGNFLPA